MSDNKNIKRLVTKIVGLLIIFVCSQYILTGIYIGTEIIDGVKKAKLLSSVSAATETVSNSDDANKGEYIRLSNEKTDNSIPYRSESKAGWDSIRMNQDATGNKLSIKIEGAFYEFNNGIWAHATSNIYYDVSEYSEKYHYLTLYTALNKTAASHSNGVKFGIYTSNSDTFSTADTAWTLAKGAKNDANKVTTPGQEATFEKIDIRGAKYIRLQADANGSNGSDHSVYIEPMLVTDNYKGNSTGFKSVAEYDKEIKAYPNKKLSDPKFELLLLQRELLNNIGDYGLKRFLQEDPANKEVFNWLMNDLNNIGPYVLGGKPQSGSYLNSLNVLKRLYTECKSDLEDKTEITTTRGKKTLGDMYKTMILALSLTHSGTVRFWSDSTDKSDPLTRYNIYKRLYHGKVETDARTTKKIGENLIQKEKFASLTVEEMRWVMNTIIDDASIEWLNWYAREVKDGAVGPYSYQRYTFGYNYAKDDYYSEASRAKWTEKYNLAPANGKWNVPYGTAKTESNPNGIKKTKMWIVFEEGSVCGGLSKNGACVWGAYMGLPNTCVSQPAHCAYIFYNQNDKGEGIWGLGNDVGGWHQTGRTEHLNERMPLQWGNQEYIDFHKDWLGMGTYVLLAQGALNQFDNFKRSREILILADIYKDDLKALYDIYNKALEALPINIDAWYGLIKTYRKDTTKTEADFYKLAEGIFEKLKYYPLPMYHLAREVQKELKTPKYQFKFTIDQTNALNEGKAATNEVTLQLSAVRQEATYLLGQMDSTLAKFSFDGDNANSIVLSDRFEGSDVAWDYSLDGKKTWKQSSAYAAGKHIEKLTTKQIESITSENDIYVHIIGVDYSEDNVFKIDIKDQALPSNLYPNDLENRVIGTNDGTEWRYTEKDNWTAYKVASPDLTGNKKVQVRQLATGTYLTSPASEFYTFTEDNQPDTRKYIPVSYLTKVAVSTEAVNNGGAAIYALDANYNTRYHSAWNGTDTNRFLVVKLDTPVHLSAVEFVPAGGGNGRIVKGEILGSATGEDGTWVSLVNNNDAPWSWPAQANDVVAAKEQTKSFEIPDAKRKDAIQYVKIVATQTNGNWFAARAFNFFEDLTKLESKTPTAAIAYSTTEKTNAPVTAKLANPSTSITITNNKGNDSYIFTENGEFTFEFEDRKGNKGTAKAKVDWIDNKAPEVGMSYKLSGDRKLVAVLDNVSEDVYLLDQNNKRTNYIKVVDGKIVSIDYLDTTGKAYKKEELDDKRAVKKTSYMNTNKDIPNVAIYTVIPNGVDANGAEKYIEEYYDAEGKKLDDKTVSDTDKAKLRQLQGTAKSNPLERYIENNQNFEFKLQDKANNIIYKNIRADYIQNDKKILAGEISYSTMNPTNKDVVATIKAYVVSETEKVDAKVVNNGGSPIYTFTENGEFTFEYADKGEDEKSPDMEKKKNTAKVTWIDKTAPTVKVKYTTRDNKTVATLSDESKEIIVTNNGGKKEYVFVQDGVFTFEFQDKAGNTGKIVARADGLGTGDLILESDVYSIEEYISGVKPKTTLKVFKDNLKTNGTVTVYKKDGKVLGDTEIVGTGMTLKIEKDGQEISKKIAVQGDTDGNGKVTPTDLADAIQQSLGGNKLDDLQKLAVDINKDGKVTPTDLADMIKMSLS